MRSVTLRCSGALSHFARSGTRVWRNPRRCPLCASQRTQTARAVQRNRDVCNAVSETKEISDPCSKSKGGKSQSECFVKNEAASYANARAEISEKEVGQRSIRQICKIKVRSKRRGNAKAEKNTAAASRKRAIAVPTPAPSPQPQPPRAVSATGQAQVVIEKSGIEEDQGLEPPPSPPPRRFGLWPWSRPVTYRYLTSSVIEAIRRAPVKRRRWQFIVVHNSGTRQGNARVFDYYHRHVRRMQNGLAYHFVIGNGTSTGNGQIEVGDRWRRQINGGHVHSDYLNNISLGICLVGDFNRDQPTRPQLDACEELIRYLRQRCGGTGRGAIPVKPHREINPPRWPTDCPGDDFPYSWFRRF